MNKSEEITTEDQTSVNEQSDGQSATTSPLPEEIGGVKGPEPTRFGDWEKNGRCVDF